MSSLLKVSLRFFWQKKESVPQDSPLLLSNEAEKKVGLGEPVAPQAESTKDVSGFGSSDAAEKSEQVGFIYLFIFLQRKEHFVSFKSSHIHTRTCTRTFKHSRIHLSFYLFIYLFATENNGSFAERSEDPVVICPCGSGRP